MAGPGKPGPPARGAEQVEAFINQQEVVTLRRKGYTNQDIADATGYSVRGIEEIMHRWRQSVLASNDPTMDRALKSKMYDDIVHALSPFAIPMAGQMPDEKMLKVLLTTLRDQRALLGSDAPTKVEFTNPLTDKAGEAEADDVQRFMELADQLQTSGYGSGRILDAEEVEQEDEDAERDSVGRVTSGVGTQALGVVPALVARTDDVVDASDGDETAVVDVADVFTPDMTIDDETDDDAIGYWEDGKWVEKVEE